MDKIKYNIFPKIDQGYTPGVCSFHLQEDESWSGVDGPGTKRTWHYHLEQGLLKDGAGATIGTIDGDPVSAGDGNPYHWNSKLPNSLDVTPEAQGNPRDYVQFTIGTQTWKSPKGDGTPRCNTGDWSSHYSPAVSPSPLLTIGLCPNTWDRTAIWTASSIVEVKFHYTQWNRSLRYAMDTAAWCRKSMILLGT